MNNKPRDTANAVALALAVGESRWFGDELARPKEWRDIGWDEIVTDIDAAAEALDEYQEGEGPEFWEEYDWYLTLDAMVEEMEENPRGWDATRIADCLVKL